GRSTIRGRIYAANWLHKRFMVANGTADTRTRAKPCTLTNQRQTNPYAHPGLTTINDTLTSTYRRTSLGSSVPVGSSVSLSSARPDSVGASEGASVGSSALSVGSGSEDGVGSTDSESRVG